MITLLFVAVLLFVCGFSRRRNPMSCGMVFLALASGVAAVRFSDRYGGFILLKTIDMRHPFLWPELC